MYQIAWLICTISASPEKMMLAKSLNKCLLNVYHMRYPVLGVRNTMMSNNDGPELIVDV